VIFGSIVSSGFPTPRKLPQANSGFTIKAQPLSLHGDGLLVFSFDIFEDVVGFSYFF
jgi:hypothetical protein